MSFLSHLFPSSSSSSSPPMPPPDDGSSSCPQDPPPPRMRLTLTPHPHVYGHPPRAGGVLLLPGRAAAPVDLEFLGLPAIPADEVVPPGAEEEEEEAFCERMRLLGAEWRESSSERGAGGRAKTVVGVGFEGGVEAGRKREGGGGRGDGGGGVWVYRVAQGRGYKRADDEDWGAARERVMVQWRRCARVEAARTMEERCRVIRECGGEYFESVEAWRKVAVEEHVREGIVDDLFLDEEEEEYRALQKQLNNGLLE